MISEASNEPVESCEMLETRRLFCSSAEPVDVRGPDDGVGETLREVTWKPLSCLG